MSMEVIRSGLLSTVQDEGRFGQRRYGIHPGGAMDTFAARVSNMVVGNTRNAAVIEMTMTGSELRFEEDQLISLCGADLSAMVDDIDIPMWRPIVIPAGAVLRFGRCRSGLRTYMAVAGGIDVPVIMGSRSTDLKTGIGGINGRALRDGDKLSIGKPSKEASMILDFWGTKRKSGVHHVKTTAWYLSSNEWPGYHAEPVIRIVPGIEDRGFTEESLRKFYEEPYLVSPQSDRMGYRMQGAVIERKQDQNRLSEAVTYGTVQIPADGQPIILMADHQTIGGYPVLGQVAKVDLPILAQARPGTRVTFRQITSREAEMLWLEQEKHLRLAENFIRSRMTAGMEELR
ncbi:antagonist of KipI [Paenibacillus amylolyticus]|uniref:Antagonist of KipI n=1 Tax=Paenibacillus amylolyticus TaxID=1451 RepID=A0AAP5H681_PAEAM|nr:biotin-dependent carboxyltransferase family protein [Paenibacillus amylolyticus]MDR6724696.1 antagonist of KipI [Paenibacillus amylolyticus]